MGKLKSLRNLFKKQKSRSSSNSSKGVTQRNLSRSLSDGSVGDKKSVSGLKKTYGRMTRRYLRKASVVDQNALQNAIEQVSEVVSDVFKVGKKKSSPQQDNLVITVTNLDTGKVSKAIPITNVATKKSDFLILPSSESK